MDQAVHEVRLKKWFGIMQEYANSGMTKVEWCRQQGIKRRSFFYWQKRLQEYTLENLPEETKASLSLISETKPVVFCEIGKMSPSNKEKDVQEERAWVGFQAEMAIQTGKYSILIGNNVSERALSTVLAVIEHA